MLIVSTIGSRKDYQLVRTELPLPLAAYNAVNVGPFRHLRSSEEQAECSVFIERGLWSIRVRD